MDEDSNAGSLPGGEHQSSEGEGTLEMIANQGRGSAG